MASIPVNAAARRTLTVPEAGRLLGLGRQASYEAARRGELPVLRIGRRLLVPAPALDRLLSGEASGPPPMNAKTPAV
jgi:excisionase family DNA binding protein